MGVEETIIPLVIFIALGIIVIRAFRLGEGFSWVAEKIRGWRDGRAEKAGLDIQTVQYE